MIQLQFDVKSINAAEQLIQSKITQAETIISSTAMTEIARAVFTITAKKFLQDLSMVAIQDPTRYHHLYEWDRIGSQSDKLFVMKQKSVKNGNLSITFVPMKSTKPVPVNARLLEPSLSGKVVHSTHIFKDKMRIMEENDPIHYQTKKTIVFASDGNRLVFVPKGHIISIMNPGGKETSHALKEYSSQWYSMKAAQIVSESNLMDRIGSEVAKTLNQTNSSSSKIQDTIKRVTSAYSKGLTEI